MTDRQTTEIGLLRHLSWRYNNVDYIRYQPILHDAVTGGCSREGRGGIDLNKPRFEVVINDDVIAIALKAMSVIRYHSLVKRI